MFKKILKNVDNKKIISLEEISKILNKDSSIISDAIYLLTTKGYLRNLNCGESNQNLKNKCYICLKKSQCHSNLVNRYEITNKGIQYYKKD